MLILMQAMSAHHRWVVKRAMDRIVERTGGDRERGDVPGWVLITLMTAALVTAIWAVAGDKLGTMLSDALDGVSFR